MSRDPNYNYQRIEKAIAFLADNFTAHPDLSEVAKAVHMSPFHFQRLFLDWVGISPKKFLQYLTLDYLRSRIRETENMIDAADLAGLSAQSRVHDLFVTIEGVTPWQYKSCGMSLEIFYGYHSSPFGLCFIAVTEKGICRLHFVDEERKRDEFELFSRQWNFAKLIHRPDYTQPYIRKIFERTTDDPAKLSVLVQGTNFQIKVWEAMLQIPYGCVTSFKHLAKCINRPEAVRAVGTAVGVNPLPFLIPCHRILTCEGGMGDFHAGRVRKKLMLGWEISATERERERERGEEEKQEQEQKEPLFI